MKNLVKIKKAKSRVINRIQNELNSERIGFPFWLLKKFGFYHNQASLFLLFIIALFLFFWSWQHDSLNALDNTFRFATCFLSFLFFYRLRHYNESNLDAGKKMKLKNIHSKLFKGSMYSIKPSTDLQDRYFSYAETDLKEFKKSFRMFWLLIALLYAVVFFSNILTKNRDFYPLVTRESLQIQFATIDSIYHRDTSYTKQKHGSLDTDYLFREDLIYHEDSNLRKNFYAELYLSNYLETLSKIDSLYHDDQMICAYTPEKDSLMWVFTQLLSRTNRLLWSDSIGNYNGDSLYTLPSSTFVINENQSVLCRWDSFFHYWRSQSHRPLIEGLKSRTGKKNFIDDMSFVKSISNFLEFSLNSFSLVFLLICFLSLYPFKLYDLTDRRKERRKQKKDALAHFSYLFLSLLCICYLSLIGASIYLKYDGGWLDVTHNGFFSLSGLINGIAFALLIGRIESRLIGLKNRIIAFLFIYPAIQPLFIAFSDNEQFATALVFVAFLCKVYFFLVVKYIIDTDRLLIYLYCIIDLDIRVDSIYANQFEISILKNEHSEEYYYEIRNKNKVVFKSDEIFEDREECEERVEHLRNGIVNEKIVMIHKTGFGTHWAVPSHNENFKLYSIEHRTQEEIEVLIEEVKQKVPYCKVSFC